MRQQTLQARQITKPAAASRLRQLLDELAMLMHAFPDLRDAFDPDELPLAFILKRDAQTEPLGRSLGPVPTSVNATIRRLPAHAAGLRGGPKKPFSDN